MPKTAGELIAGSIPARDDDFESDYMPLGDIVVTGVELVPAVHFYVDEYRPDATGADDDPWCVLRPISGFTGTPRKPLTQTTVRSAVAAFIDHRIEGGMDFEEARRLVDGSYTDWSIADSILQFALYGEEVLN